MNKAILILGLAAATPPDATAASEADPNLPIAQASSPAAQAPPTMKTPVPQISETGYTSAFVCGRCHADIYSSWKRSMHAFSLSDPVFDVAFMQAVRAEPAAKQLCLRCHAPVTLHNNDLDLVEGITREGVTCDFCHSVTAVNVGDKKAPYVVEPGRIKRSTMARANSPAHDVAFSELHSRSEFCGACHYHETENGTIVMGTFAEWQAGPYAREGVQCQDCHMVLGGGRVVHQEVKESSGPINLHDLIHDTNQLKSAVRVRVADLSYQEGALIASVEVTNVGSGHMIPTGVPNRELLLQVEARQGDGSVERREKRYRKVLAGADGKPLLLDYEAFLFARSVVSDNRIGPRETRRETFRFEIPAGERVEVTASAVYKYAPLILDQRPMAITLASDSRYIYR